MAKNTAVSKVGLARRGATVNYIDRMRQHLAQEKEKGLMGIRFCGMPAEGASALTAEKLARVYCKVFGLN